MPTCSIQGTSLYLPMPEKCALGCTRRGSPAACNLGNVGANFFSRARRQKRKEGTLTFKMLYRDVSHISMCYIRITSERYLVQDIAKICLV